MKYISDAVGEEYKQWKPGDIVFLSSPTGSGKTTFVLKVLLPALASVNGKMLYLVNRSILKRQMEEELRDFPLEQQRCIKIELYQTIEKRILTLSEYVPNGIRLNGKVFQEAQEKYSCVICDEAHYFMADSNYNTNTILSYEYIDMAFCSKLRIFMSATISQVQEVIKKDFLDQKFIRSTWMNQKLTISHNVNVFSILRGGKIWEYDAEKDYSYLDIRVLHKREEVADVIKKEDGKWLIFVDSREFGSILNKDIICKLDCDESGVAFITSDYREEDDAMNEVQFLAKKKKQGSRIVITTSVLDNGISLHDRELRNVIIIADTEAEFIQMLGRKREDGGVTKLYIYKLDKNHFLKRQRKNKQRLEIVKQYMSEVNEYMSQFGQNDQGVKGLTESEEKALTFQHKKWLRKLMNGDVDFENIRALFLDVNGYLVLNRLAAENLKALDKFYSEIIRLFESMREDAYLYEQLSWLKKKEPEIEEILEDENDRAFTKAKMNVIETLARESGQELTKEKAIKLKVQLADDLLVLAKHMGIPMYIAQVKKNDRPISDKFMNALRENCQIPFHVISKNGRYSLERTEI